jgi:glycosyltransferase involved in cell wall biosynthesis
LFGGGENFDLNVAKQLRKRGHNVRIITGRSFLVRTPPPEELFTFKVETVPFIYTAHLSNKIGNSNKLRWFLSALSINLDYLSFELSVFRKIRNDTWTDVYQICGLPRLASWIYKKLKKPVVVRWPGIPSRRMRRYLNQYPVNAAGGDVYSKIKNWCNNAEYVEIGVDTEFFKPKEKKLSDEIKFLFVGRLIRIKNIPMLLKAFSEVCKVYPKASLHIVGDGEEKANLMSLAKQLGIASKVKFYGHLYKDKLLDVYQSSDVFVIGSKYENFPNAVLEAMACGLPVIATSVGGLIKQVEIGQTGFLVPPDDHKEMAKKMLWFIRNKNKILEFGKNAREFVIKHFSWDNTGDKLESIYFRILSENE